MLKRAVKKSQLLRAGIVANLATMLLLAGYVLSQTYPSTEAGRLRNALVIEAGVASDFNWTPEHAPTSFAAEHKPAPAAFVAVVHDAGANTASGDWEKGLALAAHLTRNTKDTARYPV